jgi:hypothetical protein
MPNGTLRGAVAAVNLNIPAGEIAQTLITLRDASNNVVASRRVNTGDGRYIAIVRLDGQNDAGNVTGLVTRTHVYPAGLQLAAFPLRPLSTDIAGGLGLPASEFALAGWDSSVGQHQIYTPGQPTGPGIQPLQPGRGYFFKLLPSNGAAQAQVTITGYAPPRDTDVTVSLPFGWNLVGVPFGADSDRIAVSNLQVQYLQNGAIPWDDAVANNYVTATPFGYSPQTGGYVPVEAAGGQMQPWQGYWVRVLVPSGVTLIFPGPEAENRGRAVSGTRRAAGSTVPPLARPAPTGRSGCGRAVQTGLAGRSSPRSAWRAAQPTALTTDGIAKPRRRLRPA